MADEPADLVAGLASLKPREKPPTSARVLDTWIVQAERAIGSEQSGRLGWLVASTVITAALQRAVDATGRSLFLLKGGTLLQHRLGAVARATRDLDGLVRGDLDAFLDALDDSLQADWGPFTLRRSEVEVIEAPTRLVKPRRLSVVVTLHGVTWRRVQVEIAPDEGDAGQVAEFIPAPPLASLGLPTPDDLAGLAMRYQIAQKIHAVTDPHDPPVAVNDRARDVIDLSLLHNLTHVTGAPTPVEIRAAVVDVFDARAREAQALGLVPRGWPVTVVAYPHWADDYARAAASAGIDLSLADAVRKVNVWFDEIASAGTSPERT